MNLTDRVLLSLSMVQPCSCAELWKVMDREGSIKRESVYGALYQLRQENLVVRAARATYKVTKRGESKVNKMLGVREDLLSGLEPAK